jgi:hypothetical protein
VTWHKVFLALTLLLGGVGEALGYAARDTVDPIKGKLPLLLKEALPPALVEGSNLAGRIHHRGANRHERLGPWCYRESKLLDGRNFRGTMQQGL